MLSKPTCILGWRSGSSLITNLEKVHDNEGNALKEVKPINFEKTSLISIETQLKDQNKLTNTIILHGITIQNGENSENLKPKNTNNVKAEQTADTESIANDLKQSILL